MICTTPQCNRQTLEGHSVCPVCVIERVAPPPFLAPHTEQMGKASNDNPGRRGNDTPMSQRYPKYYKPVPDGVKELDTYAINMMFPVTDPSGAIIHARKKLLVPGTRTGGKSFYDDIKEARDTLTRWLELNKHKA